MTRPRVGISQCLLGDSVRYDGGHKRDDELLQTLSHRVEWVPVCPEVEAGMGTPRQPIHLVSAANGVRSGHRLVRLVGLERAADWTEEMTTFASKRIAELVSQRLCGFVLKKDSPSCGLDAVRVLERGGGVTRDGRGLFAQALLDALPDLPTADEHELHSEARRERFLSDVRDYELRHFGTG